MNSKTFILLSLFVLICSIMAAQFFHDKERPPNIVLVISDDQSWTDYRFMGHEHIKTPNLDSLAHQGVVFRRGYVPTPLCRPSLMTLATGHYAHRHGVTGNDPSPKKVKLNSTLSVSYTHLRAHET